MSTTTPRFKPRDGFEPMPMTSSRSSAESSPTIATTFDVPMSRPTTSLRSSRLPIAQAPLHCRHSSNHCPAPRRARPRDSPAVRRANRRRSRSCSARSTYSTLFELGGERRRDDVEESIQPLVDVAAAEPDLLAAAEHEPPRAALVELQAARATGRLPRACRARRDSGARRRARCRAAPRGSAARETTCCECSREQLAAHVQEPVSPQRAAA